MNKLGNIITAVSHQLVGEQIAEAVFACAPIWHRSVRQDEYDDESIKALTGYGPHADRQFKGARSGASTHTHSWVFIWIELMKRRKQGPGRQQTRNFLHKDDLFFFYIIFKLNRMGKIVYCRLLN